MGFDADIDATVYIYNETTSVEISCGGIPRIAIAIEWKIKKMDGWKRILKINSSGHPKYKEEYSADKYGISESTQTSLVVKNIDYSTFVSQLFRCETLGDSLPYSYTTLLVVTGKSAPSAMYQYSVNTTVSTFAQKSRILKLFLNGNIH